MSATLAGLRRKMSSAGDLQSVVRAMKAQAAASIEQYQRSIAALADYHRTVSLGLGACIRSRAFVPQRADQRKRAATIIVFGSDQGLVGRFNDVVGDFAKTLVAGQSGALAVWTVGQRVREQLGDAGVAVEQWFDVPSSVGTIAALVGRILVAEESRSDADRPADLYLVYNRIAPSIAYHPVSMRLLPLDDDWCARVAAIAWPTSGLPEVLVDDATTLAAFIREHLFISLFRACAESLASENTSRLAAMQRADKNIDDLRDSLGSEFHRLRQASIDDELFDVVAGYEALRADTARLD